jgi:hypothetical protein
VMAPGTNPEATHRQGQSTESDEAQGTFEDYREALTRQLYNHGSTTARLSDPDGFAGAIEAIRDAAAAGYEFTSDQVVWPVRGPELGSAFRTLAQAGEIECCGYAVSRRPKAHGHLVRVWRRP